MRSSRFMRIIVFFDLPVKEKDDRKIYTQFRKYLINDGFDMLQFSVYSRIVNGNDGAEKHINRLKNSLPPKGSVRAITVTEKQYESMLFLVGKPKTFEKPIDINQISIF